MKKAVQVIKNQLVGCIVLTLILMVGTLILGTSAQAQIYAPEGLNMPGAWNAWTNPPSNNLALASATQVTGGKVTLITTGTPRYQTILSVAATGGDLTAGTYEWLFTSGSSSNYYQNKWSAVTVVMDTLQLYTKEGAANNSITLENDRWYTMNWEDIGYSDTRAIFMKTSAMPVDFVSISVPSSVSANSPATINIVLNAEKSPEENIYIRYSVDGWLSSSVVLAAMTMSSGTAVIPGQPSGTVVSYYAFSSTLGNIISDFDLKTIRLHNDNGMNYTYTVGTSPATITFANLQWPSIGNITLGQDFNVTGRLEIPGLTGQTTPAPNVEGWVGISTANTDPATWTTWIPAAYKSASWVYDEYEANIGPGITSSGIVYYATRFRYNGGNYVYGGNSAAGGGFWDGVNNISGVLDVMTGIDHETMPGLKVYPNPIADVVYVELPVAATVTLVNILGKTISAGEYSPGRIQLDVSALNAGVYLLKVSSGNTQINRSIVKR